MAEFVWDHNSMSEPLIMAVHERTFLWDHTAMSNRDAGLKINGWKEVATKLGLPESGMILSGSTDSVQMNMMMFDFMI